MDPTLHTGLAFTPNVFSHTIRLAPQTVYVTLDNLSDVFYDNPGNLPSNYLTYSVS